MEKQYYAILSRDSEFNTDTVKKEDYQYLTPEELDKLTTRILFTSTNYKEAYDELQSLKNSYSDIKELAEKYVGNSIKRGGEMCIVRISVMKDWEELT